MIDKIIVLALLISIPPLLTWAIKTQIQETRKWRLWKLKEYVNDCYKILCPFCEGTGFESFTCDGEPLDFCERCESFGFLWCGTFPPQWLKHGKTWRQSEFEALKSKNGAKEAEK